MKETGTKINEIQSDIPGIILLSHGPLASGLLGTMEMVLGTVDNVTALELEEGDHPEKYRMRIAEIAEAMPEKSVFLMDIFGGSPFNQVIQYFLENGKEIRAVSGMNLGMLIAAVNARQNDDSDMIEEIAKMGKEAIINIGKQWAEQ
ncbi:PTS sugar transporter subunit IIA [Anaerostipes butyraticus]|uniref:PTS sugar transporter subunit IIA n=1 Tax=Anaerostipes butyraticus TaxID=645466 RepID=UPI0023A8A2EC|nr:PTS fructose transporter subunit IIA [Anaerostipes butyraticus]